MRIKELDGLRGLAMLLVLFYHFFCRWPMHFPYGDRYSEFYLFKNGPEGLSIFFVISGLVIFMTLDKSKNLLDFLIRRWIRLFPAMFLATIILFSTLSLFPSRPSGDIAALDAIPGLLFVEPYWLSKIFGVEIKSIEGAFWSLYVEVRFYLILGSLYFLVGRKRSLWVLWAITLLSLGLLLLEKHGILIKGHKGLIYLISDVLVGRYTIFFLLGILFYEFMSNRYYEVKYFTWMVLALLPFHYLMIGDWGLISMNIILLLLFLGVMYSDYAKKFISFPLFGFFALVSYPLYLIHENAGVSLIVEIGKLDIVPMFLLPVLAIMITAAIAYPIARFYEPFVQKWLKKAFKV